MNSALKVAVAFFASYAVATAASGLLFIFAGAAYGLVTDGLAPGIRWWSVLLYPVALLLMALWAALFAAYFAFIPAVLAAGTLQLLRARGPVPHMIAGGCVAFAAAAYLDAYGPFYLSYLSTWPMVPCAMVGGLAYWKIWAITTSNWPAA